MFFSELVDAVRYSQNWAQAVENDQGIRQRILKQSSELDKLVTQVSASLSGLALEPEDSATLSKSVNEFVSAAVAQARKRVESRSKAALEVSSSELNSEKLKMVKHLEAYLSVGPLPVIEEEISIELADGSYAASGRYRCPEEVEYEFLLDTSSSSIFRSQFTLAEFRKGAKIPVRLGKAWLKKEPVPDYEKLEAYSLSKAQGSKNHMTARFARSDTGATIDVVFSKSNGDSFVTVEYAEGGVKTPVTEEPALNKHLDADFLKESMERMLQAVFELNDHKLRLDRLEYAGVDVLATMNCFGFMQQVVKVIKQTRDLLDAMRLLDPKAALDRLKLLGDRGTTIAFELGLGARLARK